MPHAEARWSRQVAADLVGFADASAIILGALLPALVCSSLAVAPVVLSTVLQSGLIAALIAHAMLRSWGMYDTSDMHTFATAPLPLVGAITIGLTGVLGLGIPFRISSPQFWLWYATWFTTSTLLAIASRRIARRILARLAADGRFNRSVAVFGAGTIARRVHDHLSRPGLGITFAGVFDDRRDGMRVHAEGLPITGDLNDLVTAARQEQIDQIVIALPPGAAGRIDEVARHLERLPVSLHVVSHIASDLVESDAAHRVSRLGSVGLIDIKSKALSDWAPLVKAAEDLFLGAILTVVFAPLLLVVAALIKLDSPGPILFRQRRRGLNHRTFEVLKFRTMHVLEDGADIRQATRSDPRVTRLGRYLRRSSLDELPQLFNVLKGEMSLVGPRPHALVHDQIFEEMLEHYANRNQVKPGITGLAQVRGHRGETSTEEAIRARVDADLDYIRTWSLALDLKILWQTISTVVLGKNAY